MKVINMSLSCKRMIKKIYITIEEEKYSLVKQKSLPL